MKITLVLWGIKAIAVPTTRVEIDMAEVLPAARAADYAFDLSNNPARFDEWVKKAGKPARSLSVGDIVIVETAGEPVRLICAGMGWRIADEAALKRLEDTDSYIARDLIAEELPKA